jgi:hypothetical protein
MVSQVRPAPGPDRGSVGLWRDNLGTLLQQVVPESLANLVSGSQDHLGVGEAGEWVVVVGPVGVVEVVV